MWVEQLFIIYISLNCYEREELEVENYELMVRYHEISKIMKWMLQKIALKKSLINSHLKKHHNR